MRKKFVCRVQRVGCRDPSSGYCIFAKSRAAASVFFLWHQACLGDSEIFVGGKKWWNPKSQTSEGQISAVLTPLIARIGAFVSIFRDLKKEIESDSSENLRTIFKISVDVHRNLQMLTQYGVRRNFQRIFPEFHRMHQNASRGSLFSTSIRIFSYY